MRAYYNIYQVTEVGSLLHGFAIKALQEGNCPFIPGEKCSGRHFILVGRSAATSTKYTLTLTLGVKTTHTLNIQGGYIPVSAKQYYKSKRSDRIIRYIQYIALAEVLLSVISVLVWWIWKFSIAAFLHIPSYILGIFFLPCFIALSVSSMVASRKEKQLSQHVVQLSSDLPQWGIPDYKNRQFSLLAETDDIETEIEKIHKLELSI